MAYIKQLQLNNEDIYPLTHESAVVDSNGVSLSSKLGQLTLGIHTDGLTYLFINKEPVGQGVQHILREEVETPQGDVVG